MTNGVKSDTRDKHARPADEKADAVLPLDEEAEEIQSAEYQQAQIHRTANRANTRPILRSLEKRQPSKARLYRAVTDLIALVELESSTGVLLARRLRVLNDLFQVIDDKGREYVAAVLLPDDFCEDATNILRTIPEYSGNEAGIRKLLEALDGRIVAALKSADAAAKDFKLQAVATYLSGVATNFQLVQTIDQLRADAETSRDEAALAATHAKEAAGESAAFGLATSYLEYAAEQRTAADVWRRVAACVLVSVAGLAAWVVGQFHEPSVGEVIQKLAVSLPLVALAGYAVRESTRHRETANWARAVAVQLQTISAYTEPLPQETKVALKEALGEKVFLGYPPLGRKADATDGDLPKGAKILEIAAPQLEQVADLLGKATDLMKSINAGPDDQKQ